MIAIQIAMIKATMSSNAPPGVCRLKNIIDHQKFRKSCKANIHMARYFATTAVSLFQISHNDIAINKYKTVQTGPKIHEGGFHDGFTNV
jgi:hypothetical protein